MAGRPVQRSTVEHLRSCIVSICVDIDPATLTTLVDRILEKASLRDGRNPVEHADNLAVAFYMTLYDNDIMLPREHACRMFNVSFDRFMKRMGEHSWRSGHVLVDKVARRANQRLGISDISDPRLPIIWQHAETVTAYLNSNDQFNWNYANKLDACIDVVISLVTDRAPSTPHGTQLRHGVVQRV